MNEQAAPSVKQQPATASGQAAPDLTRQIERLRGLLDGSGAKAAARVEPQRPPDAATAEEAVQWLAAEISRRVGIMINSSVLHKLEAIMAKVPPAEARDWLGLLAAQTGAGGEWLALAEMLTVHETYFFRDPAQIEFFRKEYLVKLVAERIAARDRSLRLWSAACSTGEEAYTLALIVYRTLEEAGELQVDRDGTIRFLQPWSISILGSDLSRHAVRCAEAGIYGDAGLGSFRGMSDDHWRFFKRVERSPDDPEQRPLWRIRDQARQVTRFRQFNLLSAEPPERGLDALFCRNVLIYFDQDTKSQVFRLLHASLRDGGVAVFGATDQPPDREAFTAQWGPSTVLYRRRAAKA